MAGAVGGKIAMLLYAGIAAFSASPVSLPTSRVNPVDAWGAVAAGDIAYRKSDFDAAASHYRLALSIDPGCARAVWGLGRLEELHFRRAAARDYYAAAFRLDSRDPEIIRSYASFVTDRESRSILLKNYLATGGDPLAPWPQPSGGLDGPNRSYSPSMTPHFPVSARPSGMLLRVSINGRNPLRLIFDTGAKGITIRTRAAQKLDLEFVGWSLIRGFGTGEPARARIARADLVDIADLR